MYIYNYELFKEARFSDVYKNIDSEISYNNSSDYSDEFIKYKTISARINNKKIRISILWNDSLLHDLKGRIEKRTNLKSIKELNKLIGDGIEELYTTHLIGAMMNGKYSLWFSEYNFSVVVIKNDNTIKIITILPGINTNNVIKTIELKSTI